MKVFDGNEPLNVDCNDNPGAALQDKNIVSKKTKQHKNRRLKNGRQVLYGLKLITSSLMNIL